MSEDFISPEDDFQGFEPAEVDGVIANYVCAVCHGALVSFQVPGDRISIIACLEHGNVERCGRVTKNTVSIELERGYLQYKEVIRNLPDLWGSLAKEGFQLSKSAAIRIMRECVCKKCGSGLSGYYDSRDGFWKINCSTCDEDVEKSGYIKEGEYHESNIRID